MPRYTEIRNFQGGLADSDYSGATGTFGVGSYGLDIQNQAGLLQANWKLTKDSGSTVTDLILHGFPGSDGSTYFAGDSGDIYKRTSGGTWSAPRDEGERICGFIEYNGYFLWAEDDKLFRMLITGDWSDGDCQVYNDSGSAWSGTLSNTTWAGDEIDANWHRMATLGTSLYIGAGQYVTLVDSSFAVTTQGLDLPPDWVVIDLVAWNDNLIIGAYNTTTDESSLFIWDGFSDSWANQIPVPENRIFALSTDGITVFIKAGDQGNLYEFNGAQLNLVKRVPGSYTQSTTEIVYPGAMVVNNGNLLMGVSKNGGNPALEGVYTWGRPNISYPKALDLSYVISQNVTSAVEVGCIVVDGANTFISWKDTTSGSVYGVDKIDYSNRYSSALYETSIIGTNKPSSMIRRVYINMKKLPASCTVDLEYRINGDTSWTALGSQVTTTNKISAVFSKPIKFQTIQFRLTLGGNSTNTPQINSIMFEFESPGIAQ